MRGRPESASTPVATKRRMCTKGHDDHDVEEHCVGGNPTGCHSSLFERRRQSVEPPTRRATAPSFGALKPSTTSFAALESYPGMLPKGLTNKPVVVSTPVRAVETADAMVQTSQGVRKLMMLKEG